MEESASQGSGTESDPRSRPLIALSTSSVFPMGVKDTFAVAKDLGYDSVEVMITGNPLSRDPDELLDYVQEFQMPISAIHAPTLLLTQHVWGDAWNKIRLAAKMVKRVGADVMVAHPPFVWQRRYAQGFPDGVREISDSEGVKIAVENMYPWRFGRREVLMYAPHWSPIGQNYEWVTWDFSHAAASGTDSLEAVQELGSRLGHVHLTDGSGNSLMDEHARPGHGTQPVAETLRYLAETRWDGVVGVEVSTRKAKNAGERDEWLHESLEFAHRHLGG
ncbi:sugar phosphate isomerase/epimerase family protein [Curtobacterium sp. S6]|uniref:sugar phosphate isomerase/epimerase family protein n=1 Tax=Curtobacterium sp. S6 TaxID=1479623 RepID=UPI00068C20EC|nr:sugar phosphate isomerase/epimerase [Curtobacterium sp. S6]